MKTTKKRIKKILIIVITILLSIFIINEIKNIYIDMYNFKQLEKVKVILKDLKREDKQFFSLKDFNEIYKTNIKPIKNCYYIRNYESKDRVPYTFGFKLYSKVYKLKYGTEFYIYPKYDLPVYKACNGGLGSETLCGKGTDITRFMFERTISNPCRDRD